jgi:uncharacterized protein (TIGR00106 family)
MQVIVDFCLIPLGVGVSLSPYVAECQRIIEARGLKHQMHAYGTNIEGEWAEVFAAVEACHASVHAMGAPRITSTIKLGTRVDKSQSMDDKITSVKQCLEID